MRFSASAAALAAALFAVMPEPMLEATATAERPHRVPLRRRDGLVRRAWRSQRLDRRPRLRGDRGRAAAGTKGTALVAALALLLILAGAVWAYRPTPKLVGAGCALAVAGVAILGAFGYVLNLRDTGSAFGGVRDQVARTGSIRRTSSRTWGRSSNSRDLTSRTSRPPCGEPPRRSREASRTAARDSRSTRESKKTPRIRRGELFLFYPWSSARRSRGACAAAASLAIAVLLYLVILDLHRLEPVARPGADPGGGPRRTASGECSPRARGCLARGAARPLGVAPSVLRNPQKPLLVRRGTPTAFELDRIAPADVDPREMMPSCTLTALEKRPPLAARGRRGQLGLPALRRHLQRRVCRRARPGPVRSGLLDRDKLADMSSPTSDALLSLKTIALGPDYSWCGRTRTGRPVVAQVLVRLHVEPHREERELRAGDEQQRDEHDGADRDRVARDAQRGLDDAEHEARDASSRSRTRRRTRAGGSRGSRTSRAAATRSP